MVKVDQILDSLEACIEICRDEILKERLVEIMRCVEQLVRSPPKRDRKMYVHVYWNETYKGGVVAFYANCKKTYKAEIYCNVDSSAERIRTECIMTMMVGTKYSNDHVAFVKELKKMKMFYRYADTKCRFRHVQNIGACLENVTKLCNDSNYSVICCKTTYNSNK